MSLVIDVGSPFYGNRRIESNEDDRSVEDEDGCVSDAETSSIGEGESSVSSVGSCSSDEAEEEESERTRKEKDCFDSMDSLDGSLPSTRGLSNFFNGKSKSFAALSDVVTSPATVADLAKQENPFNKKRRILMAKKGRWPRRASCGSLSSASACLPPLPPVFYGHTGDGVGTQWRRCGYRNRKLCSAVAVDAASPITNTSGIRWGLSKLQGKRPEMEDDVVIRSEGLGDFTFAALFDGHAGFSSVEFLRDELYKECVSVLQDGLLLDGKNITATRNAISKAFEKVDSKLSSWLANKEMEDESGSTATVLFLRDDILIVSHVGDSSVVVSRYGKEEVLTGPHRPYGNNSVSIGEIKRVRTCPWEGNNNWKRLLIPRRLRSKRRNPPEEGLASD